MSEKSKGDTSRIVKNPLLSASVTGLTFDDFTHNALLLPAAPPIEKTIQEDVNFTKEPQPTVTVGKKLDIDTTNFSEISLKPSLDEDLPLPHATNLDSQLEGPTDESLLYQAASSFVQLPSVASTVFSTFSKVLKDYTPTSGQSREASEDKDTSEPDTFNAPQVPDPYPIIPPQPRESETFAPPPTFYSPTDIPKLSAGPPPNAACQNTYRLSSKKKAYAQVPGLSSHGASLNHPQASSVPTSSTSSRNAHNLQSDFSKQLNLNDTPSSITSDSSAKQEERSGGLFSLSSFVPPVLQTLTGFGKSSPSDVGGKPLTSQADNYNSGNSVPPGQVSGSHDIVLGQTQQGHQQPFLFNPSSYSTLVSQTQEKHHQNIHQSHTVESQQSQEYTPAIIPTNTDQQRKHSQESQTSVNEPKEQFNQPQLYNPATFSQTTAVLQPEVEPQKVPLFFTPTSVQSEKFGLQEPKERSIQSLFDTKLFAATNQPQHSWNPISLGTNTVSIKSQEKKSEPIPVSLFNPAAPQPEAQKPAEPSHSSEPPKAGFVRGPITSTHSLTPQQPLFSPEQALGSTVPPSIFRPSQTAISTTQEASPNQQSQPVFFNPLQSVTGPIQQPFLSPVNAPSIVPPQPVVPQTAFLQPARPPSIGSLPESQELRRLSTDSQGSIQPPPKLGQPGQTGVSNFRLQKGTRHYKSALTSSNVQPLNLPPPFQDIPSNFQAPHQNFSPPPPPLNTPIVPLQQIYFPQNVIANKPQLQGESLVQELNAKFEPTAPPLSDLSRPESVDIVKSAIPVATLGQPAYQEQPHLNHPQVQQQAQQKKSPLQQQFQHFQPQQQHQQEQQQVQPQPQLHQHLYQQLQQEQFYVGQLQHQNHAEQQHSLQQQQYQLVQQELISQQQPDAPPPLFKTAEPSKEQNLPTPPSVGSIQPPPLSGFFRATVGTEANNLAPPAVPVRKDSEIVDREVQQLTAVSENFSSEGFHPFVAQEEKSTEEVTSTYQNIVIHQDQVKTSEQIVEYLETVPLKEPEPKAAPYQLLRPDEHHLVRDTPSELSDSQETSKFYLFKPIDKPEESVQASETAFQQDSDVTKDIEHIPTLKYVPSEPKLKTISSDLEYLDQKETETSEKIVQELEHTTAERPVFSIANYFSNQPGNTFEHSNLFSQPTEKPQVPLNNYNSDQINNNNQTDSAVSEHVDKKNPNLDSLNNNQNLQHESALSSFFSSPQVSQCTVIENNINDVVNENIPVLEKSTQDPLEFFNTFQQGVQSDNNSVLSEDINSQSIQNFFNNPPQNLNNLTSDLNYNLVSGGIVSANLQNLRVTQTRGGLRTSSPLSTLVEPPSSACSELSSEVSSQFGTNSFYKPNDTNDNSEIFDSEILELFDMSAIKESIMNANTNVAYRPITRHWFYKKVVDSKHIWTPFSYLDSNLIEENFNEEGGKNIIPVEGGRYDVNIAERTRIPIYWAGEATEVRRCSWFYKAVDSRYCPYEEAIADILEEEYKNASITGEWRRKIPLPTGETVVFHGPTVMVHYLSSQSADSWSSSSQTPSRPRVVKRDIEEFSIEEGECKKVDHILFMVHGIGSVCDLKFRKVEEVVDEFRSIATQLVQAHYKNSRESGDIGRVEVLPVSWHSELHSEESGIDKRLRAITLESIPKLRNFANDTLLDVLFYTSPVFCQSIMNTVAGTMNKVYVKYCQRNPDFKGGVSLAGHSLGSLILFDLLCHQQRVEEIDLQNSENADETIEPMEFLTSPVADSNETTAKQISYTVGSAGTGQPYINYPHLLFAPEKFFALGSPIGMFVTIRGIDALGLEFKLPTCPRFYNIFHPYDPVAYRIEALVNPDLSSLRPVLIPHHKGRKRMHLELKETMTRVGADIKQKIFETFRSTVDRLTIKHKTDPKEIEKEVDKVLDIQLKLETEPQTSERTRTDSVSVHSDIDSGETDLPLGELNCSNRIDYVLQEAPLEFFNEYLFALKSHVCYWDSEDTILFIMKEIYSALGFRPDSQVPQQNMTIERPSSRCNSTQVSPTKSSGSS